MIDIARIGLHMPRQRHQDGYVYRTGKKKKVWTGRFYEYVKQADGSEKRMERVRVVGTCSRLSKGEAEDALRNHIRNLKNQTAQGEKPNCATFADAAIRYMTLKSGDWGKKMRGTMKSVIERQIVPALGARLVADLKPSDIKEFFNRIAESSSESLTKKCVTHVRGIFDVLVEDNVLAKNPAKAMIVTMPKTRKPNGRFLTMSECRKLLASVTGADYLILRLLLSCALRPSELFALRLDDVEDGRLRIDEAAVPCQPVGATKTDDSDAYVPLSAALELELRAYIQQEGIRNPREFLFPSEVGTVMDHDRYLARRLKPIARNAEIIGLNFQVLRRTVATHLQDHGEVRSAQGLLRHSDPQTTLKHYQKKLDASVMRAHASWDDALLCASDEDSK